MPVIKLEEVATDFTFHRRPSHLCPRSVWPQPPWPCGNSAAPCGSGPGGLRQPCIQQSGLGHHSQAWPCTQDPEGNSRQLERVLPVHRPPESLPAHSCLSCHNAVCSLPLASGVTGTTQAREGQTAARLQVPKEGLRPLLGPSFTEQPLPTPAGLHLPLLTRAPARQPRPRGWPGCVPEGRVGRASECCAAASSHVSPSPTLALPAAQHTGCLGAGSWTGRGALPGAQGQAGVSPRPGSSTVLERSLQWGSWY